ncbi:MAG: amino acid permease [Clostridiales Family XIII bacterium]|jgi:arginine/ornithine permease|nr:amino acid permease [Clostridiales Family XIII bacterium]
MSVKDKKITEVVVKGEGLNESLKIRQIIMVGVGGTIGTGMFLGSGYVLSQAGPGGAILAYLIAGLVMWLMMMCLGELSTAMPVSGSIQAYATEYINRAMGFTVGWVNWLACAMTITAQIVASAIIMKNIIPSVPTIVWVIVFAVLLIGVNALNANQFGEASFWFASLKLILIVTFTIIGIAIICGAAGNNAVGFSGIEENGGWFPKGFGVIVTTLLTTVYAYGGSELFASGGSEMKNKKDMPKAVHATTWILIGCYLVAIVILSMILPYGQADLLGSPFAYVFKDAGIAGAELIVNIIILTSALSSGNYFVYACSRYLWSLAKYNQAPKVLAKVNKRKVPMPALIVTMAFAALSIVCSFVAEDTVYLFLMHIIGGSNIFIYSIVCIAQIRFRRQYLAGGGKLEDLGYKTPLFPLVPILGILAYFLVLVGTVSDPSQRVSIFICVPAYVLIYIGFYIYTKKKSTKAANITME